jgi:hypothetical protein
VCYWPHEQHYLLLAVAYSAEQGLGVFRNVDSDSWVILTGSNQYVLPYGLNPSVQVGEVVQKMQSLADWVEVEDYESKGDCKSRP